MSGEGTFESLQLWPGVGPLSLLSQGADQLHPTLRQATHHVLIMSLHRLSPTYPSTLISINPCRPTYQVSHSPADGSSVLVTPSPAGGNSIAMPHVCSFSWGECVHTAKSTLINFLHKNAFHA